MKYIHKQMSVGLMKAMLIWRVSLLLRCLLTQHSNVLVAVHLLQDARPYRRTHAYLAAACCAELLQPPGLQRQPQMRFQPRLAVPS